MKRIVCDTSPLNYLIQIAMIGFLPSFFREVVIPKSVHHELMASPAPRAVRQWGGDLPTWCAVAEPSTRSKDRFPGLSDTDHDVIQLASENGSAIMLDDLAARRATRSLGLPLLGTLGFLELVASENLIQLPEAIRRLKQTNIRVSEALYAEVLLRHGYEP